MNIFQICEQFLKMETCFEYSKKIKNVFSITNIIFNLWPYQQKNIFLNSIIYKMKFILQISNNFGILFEKMQTFFECQTNVERE